MDLEARIKDLIEERNKIDRTIQALERLQGADTIITKSSHGRRGMSPEERKEVAARMKRYWASRRKKR